LTAPTPPTRATAVTATKPAPGAQGTGSRRQLVVIGGLLFFAVVVIGCALLTGYAAGVEEREVTRLARESQSIQEQFQLGIDDLLAARYELARERFEYVLRLKPDFPEAVELLNMALGGLNQPTVTPTSAITPTPVTPTPTPDLSSRESIFTSAQAAFSRGDWSGALDLLLLLRSDDPMLHLAEVNQMMAAALRNRGMQKLQSGLLEQGLYDLSLAARFGPLDSQAEAWRSSAAFYLLANSYFGLDWRLASQYFAQICTAGAWGACRKYAISARGYGDLLAATNDPCQAQLQYQASLNILPDNALAPTATQASLLCMTATAGTPTPTPTASGTPTLLFTVTVSPTPSTTPTLGTSSPTVTPPGTPTPSITPSASPSLSPSETPTPETPTPTPSAT